MNCYICNPEYHGDELCRACATDDPFQHEQEADRRQYEREEFRVRNAETIEIWRRY